MSEKIQPPTPKQHEALHQIIDRLPKWADQFADHTDCQQTITSLRSMLDSQGRISEQHRGRVHELAARLAASEAEVVRLNELAEGRLAHVNHSEESRAHHFARAEKAEAEVARLRAFLSDFVETLTIGRVGEGEWYAIRDDAVRMARAALAPVAEGEGVMEIGKPWQLTDTGGNVVEVEPEVDRLSISYHLPPVTYLAPHRLPRPTPRLIDQWQREGVIDRETADTMRRSLATDGDGAGEDA